MCGLPVVLSDVGLARDLVASAGVQVVVVNWANADYSQSAMAAQRRRRHQSNRDEFGAALAAARYPVPAQHCRLCAAFLHGSGDGPRTRDRFAGGCPKSAVKRLQSAGVMPPA